VLAGTAATGGGGIDSGDGVSDSEPTQQTGVKTGGLSRFQRFGLYAGPIVLAAFVVAPPLDPITDVGMIRVGLLVFAVIWWITTPVSLAMTSICALAAGVLLGGLNVTEAFSPTTNWVIWFTIGAFGLGAALEATGFNRRFALALLGSNWARGHPHRFMFMFLLSATLLSAIVVNTVITVVWLSLALTIYRAVGVKQGDTFAELNALTICWGANIGGSTTPVAHGSNPVAIAMIAAATGTTITFAQWTMIGLPMALIFAGSTYFVLRYIARADASAFARPETVDLIDRERRKLGSMPVSEKRALMWMGFAVLLWMVPDFARVLGDQGVIAEETAATIGARFSLAVPALLIPVAMCLTPAGDGKREYLLTWKEWVNGVDWGMIIFLSGILALGGAIGATETGLPEFLRMTLEPMLSGLSEYVFVFVLLLGLIVLTSVISNLVSLTIFMPVGITLSSTFEIGSPLAVGMCIGIGLSLAYLLPSGTATNAIVAGSGYLRVSTMARLGIVVVLLHTFLLTVIGYPLAKLVLG
jgi:solute carrier family 13 (sodium-dependent dicarboxylate transporter), member 2/3/5